MATAKECDERHEKINTDISNLFSMSMPTWVRGALIAAVVALFGMIGGVYLYAAATFCTKAEAGELRTELREWRKEIRQDLKDGFGRLERRMDK